MVMKVKIVSYGDSIVKGYGVTKSFIDLSSFDTINYGVNGLTTDGLKKMIKLQENCIYFIMCGLNDILNGLSIDYIMRNYEEILSILENCFVIIATPIKPSKFSYTDGWIHISKYNSILNQIEIFRNRLLEISNIKIIDFYSKFNSDEGLLFDGIHPNTLGHEKLSLIFELELHKIWKRKS